LTFKDGSKSLCHTGFTCRDTVVAGFGMYEGKPSSRRKAILGHPKTRKLLRTFIASTLTHQSKT
jgi:hypothetical protein